MKRKRVKTQVPMRSLNRAGEIRPFGSERGAALLVVLWVGAFFGILLSSFAFSMRTELVAAKNFKEKEEAAALARAGVSRALAEMVNAAQQGSARVHAAGLYESGSVKLGRGAYDVVVADEDGKLSLNGATPLTLRALLRNRGVTDPLLLDTIVDSILDWRDADDLRHVNGAEEEYYATLPLAYRPRNGPFEIVEELLLVKGMTREILYGNIRDRERLAELQDSNPSERKFGLGEYLGVYSLLTVHGSGRVNRDAASLDVLVASGLPEIEAREVIFRRANLAPEGLPGTNSWAAAGRIFRIESIGRVAASAASYRITASVIKESGLQGVRFRVIAWQEGLG